MSQLAPQAPISLARGTLVEVTLTAEGVDLTAASEVTMTIADSDGAIVATYDTAGGEVTVDSATSATIAIDASALAVGAYWYDIWADVDAANRQQLIRRSAFEVLVSPRYP